jgi:hypothetical protein
LLPPQYLYLSKPVSNMSTFTYQKGGWVHRGGGGGARVSCSRELMWEAGEDWDMAHIMDADVLLLLLLLLLRGHNSQNST